MPLTSLAAAATGNNWPVASAVREPDRDDVIAADAVLAESHVSPIQAVAATVVVVLVVVVVVVVCG